MLAVGLACWPASLMRRRTGAGGRARRRGNTDPRHDGSRFSILVGVALVILEPALRRVAVASAIVAIVVGVWALVAGPLRTSMAGMDDVWLQAVSSKDSLFASQWPVWAWLANLALLAALWWAHRRRSRDGQASREDTALVWGATALVAFFFSHYRWSARFAFPVQLQISRVFWLVDAVATIYVLSLSAISVQQSRRDCARPPLTAWHAHHAD